VVAPAAPTGSFLAPDGDAARRRWTVDPGLAPPFAFAWKATLPGRAGTVLAADGRVYASHVQPPGVAAFDAATGRKLWTAGAAQTGSYEIALAGGRVVVSDGAGVRGLDAGTGAVAWTFATELAGDLAAADGDVIFSHRAAGGSGSSGSSQVTLLDAASGRRRWSHATDDTDRFSPPAVAGDRVYQGTVCRARALDRRDGTQLWSREFENGCAGVSTYTGPRLAGGRLLIPGMALDPADGHELAVLPMAPRSVVGDVVVGDFGDGVAAGFDPDGRRLWSVEPIRTGYASGIGLNGTFLLADDVGLSAIDVATGKAGWRGKRLGIDSNTTIYEPGLPVAGAGVVVIPHERELFTIAPAARAPAAPLKARARQDVISYGHRVVVTGRLGSEFGGVTPLSVAADGWGRGGFRPRDAAPTESDGTFRFSARPARFTRYRFDAVGAAAPKVVRVWVLPRFAERITRGRSDPNAITSRVRVRVPREVRARGRLLALYVWRAKARRNVRVATGRLHGRRGRFAATLRFRALRTGRRDYLLYCVAGLDRQGMGGGIRLDRRCGRPRVKG
jgi:outer membrane protein assembly factor BamB